MWSKQDELDALAYARSIGADVLCRECDEPAQEDDPRCEVCAREVAAGEAREKRRLLEEGRGDWERDQQR